MKHSPRIRKTVKWTSAAMVVVLPVVWVASLRWWGFVNVGALHIQLSSHCIAIRYYTDGGRPPGLSWHFQMPANYYLDGLWPGMEPGMEPPGFLVIPFWCLVLLGGGFVVWVQRRDRRLSRIEGSQCPKCGYSRTGLKDASAACPECGTAPGAGRRA